jgi:hypothetical protein
VDYQPSDYKIGYSANVKITNTGVDDINGWKLAFDLPDNQTFSGGVGGNWTHDGNHLTATDWFLNASIKPNASVSLTLFGTSRGKVKRPESFTLNDVQCRTGDG